MLDEYLSSLYFRAICGLYVVSSPNVSQIISALLIDNPAYLPTMEILLCCRVVSTKYCGMLQRVNEEAMLNSMVSVFKNSG